MFPFNQQKKQFSQIYNLQKKYEEKEEGGTKKTESMKAKNK